MQLNLWIKYTWDEVQLYLFFKKIINSIKIYCNAYFIYIFQNLFNNSLTPIDNTAAALTKSEAGSGDEEIEEVDCEILPNTKHFSRNDRISTKEGVAVSAKRSLRLGEPQQAPPTKKTKNPEQVKSSAKCKPSTTADVKSTTPASPYNFTSAAQRKAMIVGKQRKVGETSRQYDTSVTAQNWYDTSGPSARKAKEEEKKKGEKEKEKEITQIMIDRNKAIQSMSDGIERWRQDAAVPSAARPPPQEETPEQMWARSLIPYLMAMEEDTRDEFMVHVLSIAVKAKKGKWVPST